MVNDSVETWRLYSAEASVRLTGTRFVDLAAARRYLTDVQTSRWWRWNVRDDVVIHLDDIGNEVGTQVNSFSRPKDDPPTTWQISMHPEQLDAYHLLHEVAHCVAPRWSYGGPTEGDELPRHVELSFHGPEFASVRLALTQQFSPAEEAEELVAAFAHYRVEVTPWAETMTLTEQSRAAEADLSLLRERHPHGSPALAALGRRGGQRTPEDLGRFLRAARTLARLEDGTRRPSQARVAELVAQVVPCTVRDISRVEHLRQPPPNRRTYQIALCLAVLFDVDPVQAQFQLGLDRDEWDVPLDELARLNPRWVELVRELDDLVRQRPPRWFSHASG